MTGLDIAAFCRSISTQHGQWVDCPCFGFSSESEKLAVGMTCPDQRVSVTADWSRGGRVMGPV